MPRGFLKVSAMGRACIVLRARKRSSERMATALTSRIATVRYG